MSLLLLSLALQSGRLLLLCFPFSLFCRSIFENSSTSGEFSLPAVLTECGVWPNLGAASTTELLSQIRGFSSFPPRFEEDGVYTSNSNNYDASKKRVHVSRSVYLCCRS
jgi:hypothetical protein